MVERPFTVLLLVPDYLAPTFGQDTYLAQVDGISVHHAVANARDEAMDEYDAWDDGHGPESFHVLFVGHGHQHNLADR